jgi:putative flippase GtrA
MHRSILRQLVRFGLVGVTNTLLTFVAYAAAIRIGVRYLPAAAAGFLLGALNGFVLNRAWTFQHGGRALASGWRYAVVQLVGLGANLAVLWAAVHLGRFGHLPGEVVAAAPVTLLTFALSRLWVFPPSRSERPRMRLTPHQGDSPRLAR